MGNEKLSHEMNVMADYIQQERDSCGLHRLDLGGFCFVTHTHSSNRRHLNVRAL